MTNNIEIKALDPRAYMPSQGSPFSAGFDLFACIAEAVDIPPMTSKTIHTGLALNMMVSEVPMVGLITPRSGKGSKEGKVLGNLIGVIDMDYQGELLVNLWNRNKETYVTIVPGEKFAQILFVPYYPITFNLVKEFSSSTQRGEGGFGSTGS